jgi:hypothetical protein
MKLNSNLLIIIISCFDDNKITIFFRLKNGEKQPHILPFWYGYNPCAVDIQWIFGGKIRTLDLSFGFSRYFSSTNYEEISGTSWSIDN